MGKDREDFEDLQAELTGTTLRPHRFVDEDHTPEGQARIEEGRRAEFRSRLDQFLLTETYRRLFERVSGALDRLQGRVDDALLDVVASLDRLNELIGDLEDQALSLDDGTLIFRDAHGDAWTADGRRWPSDALPASLNWDGATSWEQYRGAQDALHSARARRDYLVDLQTNSIDPTRRRLNDHDNPLTEVELAGLELDIDAWQADLDRVLGAKSSFGVAVTPLSPPEAVSDLIIDDVPAP